MEEKQRLAPITRAVDGFIREVPDTTQRSPHIRDGIDLKRWMILVVFALLPCTLMAIWNTGVQKLVYTSGNADLMENYLQASTTFRGYFAFCFSEGHFGAILRYGLSAFLPILVLSYAVGGFWEALFACIRRHDISEGFLVTGILFALILPPTIPYWMVALGVSFGVVVGKEIFGGTGMNILNPALTCRIFLFFAFPGQLTGNVWVGTNPTVVYQSLQQMNEGREAVDAFSQATPCALLNIGPEIGRVHVDAIALARGVPQVATADVIERQSKRWNQRPVNQMSGEALQDFVTGPLEEGGLGLPFGAYESAYQFTALRYGLGKEGTWNLFFGNRLGSLGETSILASLLGALFLMLVGIASWRTMAAVLCGALGCALLFFWGARLGLDAGAWNPAKFDLPVWKEFLIGSLVFGLVFMATEPVTSPYTRSGKWFYGLLIGALVIVIRLINPAFPEGVMLAILFGNLFSPLLDHYLLKRGRHARA